MTPQPNQLWKLEGQLFELLEAQEELLSRSLDWVAAGRPPCDEETPEQCLDAVESGIVQFIAAQLREVDGLRTPLKALEQGVSINKADAAASTNRAMVLQNKYDRLKDLIKQCMVALDQAGEWKPKESRKFESARGSFSLRGNGGAQPVEITDEGLVPDEYCRVKVTLNAELATRLMISFAMMGWKNDSEFLAVRDAFDKRKREVSKSAIAEALAQDCARCDGNGVVEAWGELDEDADYRPAENPCKECGGSGKRGVPGARFAPKGESLIIK